MSIIEIGIAILFGGTGTGLCAICIAIAYMFFES
jgi:hypothetical protein